MTLPAAFVEKLMRMSDVLVSTLSTGYTTSQRTSKTPQKITNFMDYNLGKLIGSAMGRYDNYFSMTYGRKMNDEEYGEFVSYFIDRQDRIAEEFYKLSKSD